MNLRWGVLFAYHRATRRGPDVIPEFIAQCEESSVRTKMGWESGGMGTTCLRHRFWRMLVRPGFDDNDGSIIAELST